MNRHVWTEVGGPYTAPRQLYTVICEPCGLMAGRIGDELVPAGTYSKYIIQDGEILRFTDDAPRIPPDEVCERALPIGTVVYHRSTMEWITYEPEDASTHYFVILAAQEGIVIDETGRVSSWSDEGKPVRLRLDPYEFGKYWSLTKPASVWERLRGAGRMFSGGVSTR